MAIEIRDQLTSTLRSHGTVYEANPRLDTDADSSFDVIFEIHNTDSETVRLATFVGTSYPYTPPSIFHGAVSTNYGAFRFNMGVEVLEVKTSGGTPLTTYPITIPVSGYITIKVRIQKGWDRSIGTSPLPGCAYGTLIVKSDDPTQPHYILGLACATKEVGSGSLVMSIADFKEACIDYVSWSAQAPSLSNPYKRFTSWTGPDHHYTDNRKARTLDKGVTGVFWWIPYGHCPRNVGSGFSGISSDYLGYQLTQKQMCDQNADALGIDNQDWITGWPDAIATCKAAGCTRFFAYFGNERLGDSDLLMQEEWDLGASARVHDIIRKNMQAVEDFVAVDEAILCFDAPYGFSGGVRYDATNIRYPFFKNMIDIQANKNTAQLVHCEPGQDVGDNDWDAIDGFNRCCVYQLAYRINPSWWTDASGSAPRSEWGTWIATFNDGEGHSVVKDLQPYIFADCYYEGAAYIGGSLANFLDSYPFTVGSGNYYDKALAVLNNIYAGGASSS